MSSAHPPAWLEGLFAVIPTPMRAGGAVDLDGLARVVDHYLAHGARGVVPASIAGEGHLLSTEEQRAVLDCVVRHCAGRAPVLLGVLGESVAEAAELARAAMGQGASGLLLKPPHGPEAQVLDHIGMVAQAAPVPLVLIDHPRFGASPSPALLHTLTQQLPQVCGVKLEAEPTPAKMAAVRALLGPRLRIFGGLGALHGLDELTHGADGFFTGHPQPQHLVELIHCFRAGDAAGARAAYAALLPVAEWERDHPQAMVASRKTHLRALGVIDEAFTRLPRPPEGG
ncbi:MAG TPA: dihydrodipicolinate synthase family protein [Rhizobacter sp.]|nr:dihydrodipicolinate synthase family protein [Rhizobacter sp.]